MTSTRSTKASGTEDHARRRFFTKTLLPAILGRLPDSGPPGPEPIGSEPVGPEPVGPKSAARPLGWWLSLQACAQATILSKRGVICCTVATVDGDDSHVRLTYFPAHLIASRSYAITYRARADAPRFLRNRIAPPGSPECHSRAVRLSSDWQTFQFDFATNGAAVPDTDLQFWLGQSPGTVEFAIVSIACLPVCLPAQTNSLELRVFGAAQAIMASDAEGVRIDVAAAAEPPWHVQLSLPEVALEEKCSYILSYRSCATPPRIVRVYAQASGEGDYHSIGLEVFTELTTQWQTFQHTFQAFDLLPRPNEIQFQLGQADGSVWLADVALTSQGYHLVI